MKGRFEKMKSNTIKTFVTMIVLTLLIGSEVGAAAFVKKVEGAGRFSTAIQTRDGSYVSISTTEDGSAIIRKVSDSGERIWERRLYFEKRHSGFVFLNGIAQTDGGGYVVVGWGPDSYYSLDSAVIVKLRPNGTIRWKKAFVPFAQGAEIFFRSVSSTADGGYIVQGDIFQYPQAKTILVKFTSRGEVVWSKSFPTLAYSISQPVPDGLILVHQSDTEGRQPTSRSVLKIDDSGQIVWKESLKIEGFHLHTLGPVSGNGVVLAGKSSNSNELILIGLNENGEIHWKAKYSLKVPDFDISSLVQSSDGGYVITGTRFNPKTAGNRGGIVLRINAKRNLVFQKTFGLSDTEEDAGSVFAIADGGFAVFGSSGLNDMLVLNLSSDGVVPGCRFLHKLSVKKVASPEVTSENLEIVSEDFSLPSLGWIYIGSSVSGKQSSNACP